MIRFGIAIAAVLFIASASVADTPGMQRGCGTLWLPGSLSRLCQDGHDG